MIILCQGDFKEQTQKLLLLYTTENCWRKTKPVYILYPACNPSVKATLCSGQASDSSYNITHMTLLTSIEDPH